MSSSVFNKQILSEKLSKFNSSQQSIQSLATWCISHRKKAKLIVETWDKQFNSSQRDQRVSYLYLANDILQNSRRKGSEFVNEFWKVIPAALKHVQDNGNDYGKTAVFRLTNIWEERKVFGSRGQNLKEEILGKEPPTVLVSNVKSSNLIKILKRDAVSVRIKLPVGEMPEKLLMAFQAVQEECVKEESASNSFKTAVQCVKSAEDNIQKTIGQGDQQCAELCDELQKQESILVQCVGDFEAAETTRATLASMLREALQEQESELELIRTQLLVAKSSIEQAREMKKRLTTPPVPLRPAAVTDQPTQTMRVMEPNYSSFQPISTQPFLSESAMSFPSNTVSEEEKNKAAAAAVAARLTASTSSAQMLSSVLSSLVAEEAAAMNGGPKSAGFATDLLKFSPLKRQKMDQQSMTSVPLAATTGMQMQPLPQPNQVQAMFLPPPLPPPPPPPPTHASPTNPPPTQFGQPNGPTVGLMPYGYVANILQPPPPFPPHMAMGVARPPPITQHQHQQPPHQPPSTEAYFFPPGFGFYGQTQPLNSPPVARQ